MHRPRLKKLASMFRATRLKCCPSSSWPYPCSNTFWQVPSTLEKGDIRAVEAVDPDGSDKVITHLRTTCKLQELRSLCRANSFLVEEAWHRYHPRNNKICNPDLSDVYKWYNNWNACFSCGFNVENDHTSTTCPFNKINHQQTYTRKNA